MSVTHPYFSIIIVGAGPTGLAMGNLLGIYGLDALLIERGVPAPLAVESAGGDQLDHAHGAPVGVPGAAHAGDGPAEGQEADHVRK